MFNAPILDVAIGLVFVFLLYSLLATSLNEFIATTLALRARMLRKAIAERMLSNSSNQKKLASFFEAVGEYALELVYMIVGKPKRTGSENNIGDQFYNHPMIKNYGANRYFKTPSYLAASNFAIILTEVLKEDFNHKVREIAFQKISDNIPLEQVIEQLNNSSDITKIKALFDYYAWYYAANPQKKIFDALPDLPRGLDKETHCILQLHLRNSLFDFNEFTTKVEGWYNDTMDRVSGWYKRQTQYVLFLLGIGLAFTFNVDTIDISNKLSTDKDARDQIVQLAIQSADVYKNDPRVQKSAPVSNDTAQERLLALSQAKLTEARNTVDSTLKNPNLILGIGWGKYGADDLSFIRRLSDKTWHKFLFFGKVNFKDSLTAVRKAVEHELDSIGKVRALAAVKPDTSAKTAQAGKPLATATTVKKDSLNKDSLQLVRFYRQQKEHFPIRIKTAYIRDSIGARKLLGFLVTAFAICLGAPFWFDLLSKLVRLRGAGKKEDSSNQTELAATKPVSASITTNINTQSASEEAVG